jgi:hypothetical protein
MMFMVHPVVLCYHWYHSSPSILNRTT